MLERSALPQSLSKHYDARKQSLPYPVASTPVPNHLLDEVMPILTDSEWRLLCVVCRQTLGFASGENKQRRRAQDWLTHQQLKVRTGRASAAVSKAIDGLVRKTLIEVRGGKGQPLVTPAERRRCQGMLFYSLAARLCLEPSAKEYKRRNVDKSVENTLLSGIDSS